MARPKLASTTQPQSTSKEWSMPGTATCPRLLLLHNTMKNTIALWEQKLADVRDMYEGSVQIPLHSADVKSVLAEYCPEQFIPLRDELNKRTPTHVLMTPDELESLLDYIGTDAE